jgi:hypothetical protein
MLPRSVPQAARRLCDDPKQRALVVVSDVRMFLGDEELGGRGNKCEAYLD